MLLRIFITLFFIFFPFANKDIGYQIERALEKNTESRNHKFPFSEF
jgi:hypothetical protein